MAYPILVLGGYGVFGTSVCRLLARDPEIQVLIGGRSKVAAESACTRVLAESPSATVNAVEVTLPNELPRVLDETGARTVIHAAGPFQGQDYAVARTCIARRVHYLDLADGRQFVSRFTELNYPARDARVCAISGASSVPGLSSAVVPAPAADLASVEEIEIGIAPGNRTPRGAAVVSAILSYAGKPVRTLKNGSWQTLYGWQHLRRRAFKRFGETVLPPRWFCFCDVPDLQLLPTRHTSLRSLMFRAGLERSGMQLGLWAATWPVRWGWIKSLEPYAGWFLRMAKRSEDTGSDQGGMYVEVRGHDDEGRERFKTWSLVAKSLHGPLIPAVPAVILARRFARGNLPGIGARPCVNLITLREFEEAVADLDISMWREDRSGPAPKRKMDASHGELTDQRRAAVE